MGDPSQRIDPVLLNHLHLISSFAYPKYQQLSLQQIIQFLAQAPEIVNAGRPVSWTYLGVPPEDGTIFLEYVSAMRAHHFATDGYVWLDPERGQERTMTRDMLPLPLPNFQDGEYVLEVMQHNAGFVPGREQFTVHARHRYRIRRRDNQNGGIFNHSLWLVHYKPTEPHFRVPVNSFPPQPPLQALMHERQMIQVQGQLQRKEFMLLDRSAWPQITFPHRRPNQPQFPMGQPPGFYPGGPPAAVQGPPAKRARQTGPAQLSGAMRAPSMLPHDPELEEAEDTAAGDFLDYITPATISRMRFKTHHLWFEEVFSSLYSISHIHPEDMGFGLVGELGDLTKDILNPPNPQALKIHQDEGRLPKQNVNKGFDKDLAYKHLEPEKLNEFEKRVDEFVKSKEREMEEMQAKHAKMMSRINKGKVYLEAEERLRAAGTDSAKIDEIVRDVELKMGISLEERKDVVCVQEGPTMEDENDDKEMDGMHGNGQYDDVNGHGVDSAAGLLDEFTSTADLSPGNNDDESPDDQGLNLMDDIDMDVDMPIPAAESTASNAKLGDEWVVVENQPTTTAGLPQTSATAHASATDKSAVDESHVEPADDLLQPDSMFESADFDSFENMEGASYDADEPGDGLLDFSSGFGGAEPPAGDA